MACWTTPPARSSAWTADFRSARSDLVVTSHLRPRRFDNPALEVILQQVPSQLGDRVPEASRGGHGLAPVTVAFHQLLNGAIDLLAQRGDLRDPLKEFVVHVPRGGRAHAACKAIRWPPALVP